MFLKIISIGFLTILAQAFAMEQEYSDLKGILLKAPSLKFLAAWQAAKYPFDPQSIPEEVLEFVNKIKAIQACSECEPDEKKFFINLLNTPDIDAGELKKSLPDLSSKYPVTRKKYTKLKPFLNMILTMAVRVNALQLANLALEFGANVNARGFWGDTALILAAGRNNKELVQMLLDKGADVNIKNDFEDTASKAAQKGGYADIAELLKSYIKAKNLIHF